MKKLLIIPLVLTLGACYNNAAEQSETYALNPNETPMEPSYGLALDCVDWRVFADVYNDMVFVTAQNIYTPRGVIFAKMSFNAELEQISNMPAEFVGTANDAPFNVTLSFPYDQSTDPIYSFTITDFSDPNNLHSYRYICNIIFPDGN